MFQDCLNFSQLFQDGTNFISINIFGELLFRVISSNCCWEKIITTDSLLVLGLTVLLFVAACMFLFLASTN